MKSTTVVRNRKLTDKDDVYTQNAWDDTEWTEEMLGEARESLERQKEDSKFTDKDIVEIESHVATNWNVFYRSHADKFFKDRRWIFSEFPEILEFLQDDSPPCNVFEVGCGVGNSISYIMQSNTNQRLHVYCCDLSSIAIEILKKRDIFSTNSDKVTAFQADICNLHDIKSHNIAESSIDFIMLIFILSALKPENLQTVINNLASFLKPGGMIFMRDYAQNDLSQLRFKGKSFIKDNYYIRADGTTSFFFSKEIIADLFKKAGLSEVQLKEDNRLLVNRSKNLQMFRCWIQSKFVKF